ncbi:MAG: hypothetical protein A3K19_13210 [Lentisphaerae bacterium RIFOXYB12_FULL_65_16]|nr:MAG: hypothetical protein A3K18_27310 [Lentisphaerae bacterium RIFOXYA12_64_32]OGV87267.1 MAG: hypothetical protein A3K19_13210 [Lentisphaerae bacterium RIFOXYB12_FULL_65_16]
MDTDSDWVACLDCGSTNLKAALFDRTLIRVADSEEPVTYLARSGDRAEMDPDEFWAATVRVLRRVCERAQVDPRQVRRLAITSQAQTFTVLSPAGKPMLPLISWMDTRATAEAQAIAARFGPEFHQHCSFAAPVPQLLLCKLLWACRNLPDGVPSGSTVLSLPGLVCRRLTGMNVLDANLAAMSGAYSLQTGNWWTDVLRWSGLEAMNWPRLLAPGQAFCAPRVTHELNLASELNIVLAGNDQTAGAMGNGCGPDDVVVTLGTALVAYCCRGSNPGPYNPGGCWGPYPGGGYYELATRDEGCLALDWARNRLLPDAPLEQFLREAHLGLAEILASADSGATPFCAFFPERIRSGNPWSAPAPSRVRAAAVLEGITYSLRQLVGEELRTTRFPNGICVTGGGSRDATWLQLLAETLNAPVRRGNGDALLGAALMARGPGQTERGPVAGDGLRPTASGSAAVQARFERWLTLRRET